jgi:uncharacterized protein YqhQ
LAKAQFLHLFLYIFVAIIIHNEVKAFVRLTLDPYDTTISYIILSLTEKYRQNQMIYLIKKNGPKTLQKLQQIEITQL